ncbi:MAG: tetratricopeptide repeat protein [Terriglobia bacterium]
MCKAPVGLPLPSREGVLVVSFAGLIVLFVVTGFVAQFFHRREEALAENWFHRGEESLARGDSGSAIDDLRSAMSYAHDNPLYRLRLAQALIAAHRPDEARAHLVTLWERQPGDGVVNLELARLAAARGSVQEAARYYHNSIFAVWDRDPTLQRRQARFEFCEFLLSHRLLAEAQAALIEMAADLPNDPDLHERVGALMLRAQDPSRALQQFEEALRIDGRSPAGLSGAGEAAFRAGRYPAARLYLERAARLGPLDEKNTERLQVSRLILSLDPFQNKLPARERAARTIRVFQQALDRLKECAAQRGENLETQEPETRLQREYARAMEFVPSVNSRELTRNPDTQANVAELALEIERLASETCGAGKDIDRALVLLARQREGGNHD